MQYNNRFRIPHIASWPVSIDVNYGYLRQNEQAPASFVAVRYAYVEPVLYNVNMSIKEFVLDSVSSPVFALFTLKSFATGNDLSLATFDSFDLLNDRIVAKFTSTTLVIG